MSPFSSNLWTKEVSYDKKKAFHAKLLFLESFLVLHQVFLVNPWPITFCSIKSLKIAKSEYSFPPDKSISECKPNTMHSKDAARIYCYRKGLQCLAQMLHLLVCIIASSILWNNWFQATTFPSRIWRYVKNDNKLHLLMP